MRFADERYVRFYTRKTVTWKKLGWEGRAVWQALLCEFDRAGIFALSGEDPVAAIFLVSEIPETIVKVGLSRLLKSGTVIYVPEKDALFAPRFMEAQEASQTNAARQRTKRERAKARSTLREIGVVCTSGQVYFAFDPDADRIKIGYTGADSWDRLGKIRTQYGSIRLLGHIPGSREIEKTLHDKFADARIEGEWFRPTSELLAYIDTYAMSQNVSPDEEESAPESDADDFVDASQTVSLSSLNDTEVSKTTHRDTLKLKPSQPSLTDLDLAKDQNRRSKQQSSPARGRAREAGELESATRPEVGLERAKHPDEDFTDATNPLDAAAYVPSPWLVDAAMDSGLDASAISRTLERYRQRSSLPPNASQRQHDKAFKGWLKNRQFDAPPAAPAPRSNGSGVHSGECVREGDVHRLDPEKNPDHFAGLARKPPWHPDFKKQEGKT